jgi:hypothetical protein
MALVKFTSDSKVKILDKTIFSTSGGGGGGNPVDTTIYGSSGNILFTINGNVPDNWKDSQNITGYVEVGTSATSIGTYAFAGNRFTSVTIPDPVNSIGSYAFFNNELTLITIANSVTSIGDGAFITNYNLTTVNCYATQSAFVGSNAFLYTPSPLTIHVRATDGTWTAGTGLSFQGNNNVTVIKDL